jgi:hypothetical protein
MKNTIYKFKIPEHATTLDFPIRLPEDENSWDVVEVKFQDGIPYMWIDIEEEMFMFNTDFHFRVFHTGEERNGEKWHHVKTFTNDDASFVGHLCLKFDW